MFHRGRLLCFVKPMPYQTTYLAPISCLSSPPFVGAKARREQSVDGIHSKPPGKC